MQISGLNYYLFNSSYEAKPSSLLASDAPGQVASKARALADEANEKSAHATALSVERYRIAIKGETVTPESRLSLEGVTAEYLSHMTDGEYLTALQNEADKSQQEAAELGTEMWKTLDPSRPDPASKPLLAEDEAKSTLEGYVSTLSDSIKSRNQLQSYLQSDDAWSYLVDRFGEEGARAERDRTRTEIGAFDGLIKNTLTSLNVIYSLDPTAVATEKDGFWTMTGATGQYASGAALYNFSIGEDGSVQDR